MDFPELYIPISNHFSLKSRSLEAAYFGFFKDRGPYILYVVDCPICSIVILINGQAILKNMNNILVNLI